MNLFYKLDYLIVLVAIIIFVGHYTNCLHIFLRIAVLSVWGMFRRYIGPNRSNLNEEDILREAYLAAGKYLEKPIHVHEYMEKKGITYEQVKALINSGEISAWGGVAEESVFINDEN